MPAVQSTMRKRMRCKTKPTPVAPPPVKLLSPLELELLGVDGLAGLPEDARRHCVHYTMTKVTKAGAVQPSRLTRQKAWEHLCRLYTEAYPDATSKTNSILQFGLVAQEKHKDAPREEDRSIHFHIATFSEEKHYWKRIRDISAKKYNIYLNAVAHDGYSSMYRCSGRFSGELFMPGGL
jgi:hypothetical protein